VKLQNDQHITTKKIQKSSLSDNIFYVYGILESLAKSKLPCAINVDRRITIIAEFNYNNQIH